MDHDDHVEQSARRRFAVIAAVLALAAGIPVAGALASGSGGESSGDGTPPATQGVQDQQDRQDRPDHRDRRDCPKDKGGSSGTESETALPV
jgi:hypothetical protein